MYEINDTICAISSAPVTEGEVGKSIIRISGSETYGILNEVFGTEGKITPRGLTVAVIDIADGLEVETVVYAFPGPGSYTGQDLAEIHLFAAGVVVQRILARFLDKARQAEPGEFTLRAYLNGKMDLSQAEAVAEIVASSNRFQLAAAEKLLSGALCETTGVICGELLDIMSLIEAGMDFSTEDIEFVTSKEAVKTISAIREKLERLLESSIRYEQEALMPAVGIAGAANAGKSSLLNALLGQDRSIVSSRRATTRDVLTGELELENCHCALFDCAGLSVQGAKGGVLEELAQQAAIEALNTAQLVLFCVDIAKSGYAEDIAISKLIEPSEIVLVATKSDLLSDEELQAKVTELNTLFGHDSIATSTVNGMGLEDLPRLVDETIIRQRGASTEADERIAITERHRRSVQEAIKNLTEAENEISAGNDEVAAMLLRGGYQELTGIERQTIDEEILERIFSNFCIGK